MKIAMAQMAIGEDIAENLRKSIQYIEEAAGKADFIFFSELQLTPFYPLHPLKHWGVERKDMAFTFHSEEEIDLGEVHRTRNKRPYIRTRRSDDFYCREL
ncbi:MAG: hypothetical protein Q4B58_08695 [Bacteroidales bacterium]|nr:hypothetical protein [Bacteroidales bacterium]